MKVLRKIVVTLSVVALLAPWQNAYAVTNTNSAQFVAASSQSLSIADASQTGLEPSLALSVSLWFQFSTVPNNAFFDLVRKDAAGTDRQYIFEFYNDGSNNYLLCYYSDGVQGSRASVQSNALGTISTGVPYHFACTITALSDDIKVYKNAVDQGGTPAQNGNTVINNAGTQPFKISAGADGFANGFMDEVIFYNANIGSAGVSQNYNTPCAPYLTNAVSQWRMEGGATDSIGSNNLTNNNVVTFPATPLFSCAASTNNYYYEF